MNVDPAAYAWRLIAARLHHDGAGQNSVINDIGDDSFGWMFVALALAAIITGDMRYAIRGGQDPDRIYAYVAEQIDRAMNPDLGCDDAA